MEDVNKVVEVDTVDQLDPARPLTNREREMLEFERLRFVYQGARETAVRERFDLSLPVYNAHVLRLIDRPAAEAYDAPLVRRLRRLRDLRRRQRTDPSRR